jgi:hypothetical protein
MHRPQAKTAVTARPTCSSSYQMRSESKGLRQLNLQGFIPINIKVINTLHNQARKQHWQIVGQTFTVRALQNE